MFLGLSQDQWKSLLRTAACIGLTWLVSSGRLSNEQAGQLTNLVAQAAPIIAIVGTVVWGIITRSPKNIALSVGAMPGVTVRVDTTTAPATVVAAAMDKADNGVSPS
jgi:hypothetical protein